MSDLAWAGFWMLIVVAVLGSCSFEHWSDNQVRISENREIIVNCPSTPIKSEDEKP